MSSTANWSYTNVATIRPRIGESEWGGVEYGPEYEIACTWAAVTDQERGVGGQSGGQGAELVMKHSIYTEDRRPKYLDLIRFDGSDGWEEIRSVQVWDMSFFDEEPDVLLVTG